MVAVVTTDELLWALLRNEPPDEGFRAAAGMILIREAKATVNDVRSAYGLPELEPVLEVAGP